MPWYNSFTYLLQAPSPFAFVPGKSAAFKFIALLGLLVGVTASASVREVPAGLTVLPLAGITNDRDSSVSRLNLMLDARAVVRGIYMETSAPGRGDGEQAAKPVSTRVYWMQNIDSPQGVVLGEGQGVKAILLRGTIDSGAGRGSLEVRYLSNGLLMKYHACRLDLRRTSPQDWRLLNAYSGQQVTQIEVKTWTLGISTLKNVCPVGSA